MFRWHLSHLCPKQWNWEPSNPLRKTKPSGCLSLLALQTDNAKISGCVRCHRRTLGQSWASSHYVTSHAVLCGRPLWLMKFSAGLDPAAVRGLVASRRAHNAGLPPPRPLPGDLDPAGSVRHARPNVSRSRSASGSAPGGSPTIVCVCVCDLSLFSPSFGNFQQSKRRTLILFYQWTDTNQSYATGGSNEDRLKIEGFSARVSASASKQTVGAVLCTCSMSPDCASWLCSHLAPVRWGRVVCFYYFLFSCSAFEWRHLVSTPGWNNTPQHVADEQTLALIVVTLVPMLYVRIWCEQNQDDNSIIKKEKKTNYK